MSRDTNAVSRPAPKGLLSPHPLSRLQTHVGVGLAVGTGDGAGERQGPAFDTPSLLGLYAANSYLHDGRARSLAEVFTTHNPADRHGVTSHLSEDQVEDLVAFLLSLPAGTSNVTIREIDGPIDHNHCTTRQFQHVAFRYNSPYFWAFLGVLGRRAKSTEGPFFVGFRAFSGFSSDGPGSIFGNCPANSGAWAASRTPRKYYRAAG